MVTARNLFSQHHPLNIPVDFASAFYELPLDRVDPINVNCSARSLWVLPFDNPFRKKVTWVTHHRLFKAFILAIILLNSVTLALRDPQLQDADALQKVLDITDIVFISLFAVEMVMKIISYGFLLHGKSYLRHAWNLLDAIVVVSGCIALFVNSGNGVSALRVIRVFRPLRAFAYVKSLRHILNRLVKSIPKMGDVFVLLIFIIWLLDVVGVHLFMGILNARCFADVTNASSALVNQSDPSLILHSVDNRTFAMIRNDTALCALTYSDGRTCSMLSNGVHLPQRCMQIADAQLDVPDSVYNFNNALYAFLLVFKIICRDNWPNDYVHLAEGVGVGGSFCYMFVATLFAGYFCVNLFIAVFETVFSAKDDDDDIVDAKTRVSFATVLGARTVARAAVFASMWKGREDASAAIAYRDDEDAAEAEDRVSTAGHQNLLESFREESIHAEPPAFLFEGSRPEPRAHEPTAALNDNSNDAPKRRSRVSLLIQRFFYLQGVERVGRMCDSGLYQLIVMAVVVLNATVLAMDRVGLSTTVDNFVKWSSFTFTILFIVDAIIKLVGYGPSFFRSGLNVADFILCVVSIPDIVNLENSAFSALRAFRLVRLLRISQRWTDLRQKLDLLVEAVRSVASLSVVAFIIMYIYAILGFQLFGEDIRGMRMSFATVFDSLLTVFICITGEDQNDMAAVLAEEFGLWSVIYFITLTIFGNFVLTNIFIAIILENFATQSESSLRVEQKDDKRRARELTEADLTPRLPPTAHATSIDGKRRRIVLEPDEVGNSQVLSSSLDDADEEEEGVPVAPMSNASIASRRTDSFQGVRTMRSYRVAAARIAEVVDVEGAEPLFEQFARDQHVTKTHLVQDASTLASDAERRITTLEEEMEHQTSASRNRFASAVSAVISSRKPGAQRHRTPPAGSTPVQRGVRWSLENFSVKFRKFQTIAERESQASKWQGLQHQSLCFPATNKARMLVGAFLRHPVTEWTLVLVTLASSIFLVLDNDHVVENREQLILITDVVFCAIFVAEVFAKIFALGVYRHPGSYFQSMWNWVDLLVALFSFIALFKSDLKLFRAFRVLRMLNLSFTLRVITSSILAAIPGMTSVMVFVGLLFLIYALFGVGLFKGFLGRCSDPLTEHRHLCNGTFTTDVTGAFAVEAVTMERHWERSFSGCTYDNIEGALFCLFRMANQDNWFVQMYAAVDHYSGREETHRNANPLASLYFISFMVVGQFFAVNLFIGVLVDRFLVQRRRGEGHALLTPAQQQWILVQRVLFRAEVRGEPQRPVGYVRSRVFDVCSHWFFDATMYFLITANSVLLSAYFFEMSDELRHSFDLINVALIALFTLEILLKCIAFGPWSFFALQWNRLDVLVVALSWVGVIFQGTSSTVGVFRVARLLMLLRKMKGLQTLFVTLYHAVPEFLNVALVLMVLYFVFAIVGVQLFGNVPRGPIITEYLNFEHAGSALITLYIMMTQESWGDITDALAEHSAAALPFSIAFMMIVSWVAINLLVTVVIDVFGEAEDTERQDASLRVIDQFRQVWCSYDPNGVKILPCNVVLKILPTMPSSIWDRSAVSSTGSSRLSPWLCVLRQLERLHIPLDAYKRVRYEDCVGSLALRLFSLSIGEAIHVSQSTVHGVSWKPTHFSIHHEYAALMISRTYRRFQATRRERQLEAQVRALRDQHAIVVEAELQPLRKAYHDAMALIRWMAAHRGTAPPLQHPPPGSDTQARYQPTGRRFSGVSDTVTEAVESPDAALDGDGDGRRLVVLGEALDDDVEVVFPRDEDAPPLYDHQQQQQEQQQRSNDNVLDASIATWTMSVLDGQQSSSL